MPNSVLWFERLYLVAFLLVIGSAIIEWNEVSASTFPLNLLTSVLHVALAFLVSRKRSWVALAVLVILNLDNLRDALLLPTALLVELLGATAIIINVIPLVAFACLLTPSARAWLSKKAASPASA